MEVLEREAAFEGYFRIDRYLEHLLSSLTKDLIEWTSLIELSTKLKNFRIGRFRCWNCLRGCCSFAHGVFLVPSLGR